MYSSEAAVPFAPDLQELSKASRDLTRVIEIDCQTESPIGEAESGAQQQGYYYIDRPMVAESKSIQTSPWSGMRAATLTRAVLDLITESQRTRDIVLGMNCSHQFHGSAFTACSTTPLPSPLLFLHQWHDVSQYDERLQELREAAADEGCDINEKSIEDFSQFLLFAPYDLKRPNLALVDDGDIRASWRADDRRLAVQFFGDGTVEYVMLGATPIIDRGTVLGFFHEHDMQSLLTA